MVNRPFNTHMMTSRKGEFAPGRGAGFQAENPKRIKSMSFKDLTARAAALLKSTSAETSKKASSVKATDTGAKPAEADKNKS